MICGIANSSSAWVAGLIGLSWAACALKITETARLHRCHLSQRSFRCAALPFEMLDSHDRSGRSGAIDVAARRHIERSPEPPRFPAPAANTLYPADRPLPLLCARRLSTAAAHSGQ